MVIDFPFSIQTSHFSVILRFLDCNTDQETSLASDWLPERW